MNKGSEAVSQFQMEEDLRQIRRVAEQSSASPGVTDLAQAQYISRVVAENRLLANTI